MKKLEKNWFEWCVFSIGSVLVLGTVGYLVYEALFTADKPPSLEVRIGSAERHGDEYTVPVVVRNRGDLPAKTVRIIVQLDATGDATERAELEIELVPGKAERQGFVTFESDPGTAERVSGRAVSFETL